MTGRVEANPPVSGLRFGLMFSLYALLVMIAMRADEVAFGELLNWTVCAYAARGVATVLHAITGDGFVDGIQISYAGQRIHVIAECVGVEVIGLFVAAVLAFPAPTRSKLRMIVLGVGYLILVNQVRMITLVYAAAHWPTAFGVAHLYIWPVMVLATALALWATWAQRMARAGS